MKHIEILDATLRGVSADVIGASIRADVNAISKRTRAKGLNG